MGCTTRWGGTKILYDLDGGMVQTTLSHVALGLAVLCTVSLIYAILRIFAQRNLAEHFA